MVARWLSVALVMTPLAAGAQALAAVPPDRAETLTGVAYDVPAGWKDTPMRIDGVAVRVLAPAGPSATTIPTILLRQPEPVSDFDAWFAQFLKAPGRSTIASTPENRSLNKDGRRMHSVVQELTGPNGGHGIRVLDGIYVQGIATLVVASATSDAEMKSINAVKKAFVHSLRFNPSALAAPAQTSPSDPAHPPAKAR